MQEKSANLFDFSELVQTILWTSSTGRVWPNNVIRILAISVAQIVQQFSPLASPIAAFDD